MSSSDSLVSQPVAQSAERARWKHLWVILAVFLLLAAIYLPFVVSYQFLWDDYPIVNIARQESPQTMVTSLRYVSTFGVLYWRPLAKATVALNYSVSRAGPTAYALTDFALHLAVVALVYMLMWRVSRHHILSGFAAVLFGVHQAAASPALWLGARQETLPTLWTLLAVISFLSYLKAAGRKGSAAWGILTLLCQAAALASKESAVILPGILAAAILLHRKDDQPRRPMLVKAGGLIACSVGIVVLWWLFRSALGPSSVKLPILEVGLVNGLAEAGRHALTHLAALFSPVDMSAWILMTRELSGYSVVMGIVGLFLSVSLFVALARWQQRRVPSLFPVWGVRLAFFAIAWLAVTLLPDVFLGVPGKWRAYTPLVGAVILTTVFLVALTGLVSTYVSSRPARYLLATLIGVFLLSHVVQNIRSNALLIREGAEWNTTVEKVVSDMNAERVRTGGRPVDLLIRTPAEGLLPLFANHLQQAVELRTGLLPSSVQVVLGGQCPGKPDTSCVDISGIVEKSLQHVRGL